MATEKWLIDANALKDRWTIPSPEPINTDAAEVLDSIDEQPTVDAVEVVHGRWEDMWDGKYANPRYRCSVCKEKANYKSVQDELLSWHDVQVLTPYCPYCGAKMDGGICNDIKAV